MNSRIRKMCSIALMTVALFQFSIPPGIASDTLAGPPMVTADAWLVADQQTGKILESVNAEEQRQIASLTKLITALVAVDIIDGQPALLDHWVVISSRAAGEIGTSARLQAGERLQVRDLLYGMLLPSGNDAAMAIVESLGKRLPAAEGLGVEDRFLRAMKEKTQSLDMQNTILLDAHGMGGNLSTPADLLKLSRAVLDHQLLSEIVGTAQQDAKPASLSSAVKHWKNTNVLLGEFSGIKTGHTFAAGGCLILSGDHGESSLIVIVLDSSNQQTRFMDAFNLYQWGWKKSTGMKAGMK